MHAFVYIPLRHVLSLAARCLMSVSFAFGMFLLFTNAREKYYCKKYKMGNWEKILTRFDSNIFSTTSTLHSNSSALLDGTKSLCICYFMVLFGSSWAREFFIIIIIVHLIFINYNEVFSYKIGIKSTRSLECLGIKLKFGVSRPLIRNRIISVSLVCCYIRCKSYVLHCLAHMTTVCLI